MSIASSSTICSNLHVDGTSPDHAIVIDDDEHHSTGYSEFCDDDAILEVQNIICDSSPTGSFPATTLGKRKSPEDSGSSEGVYASYKRHISTASGGDSAESCTEPYIVVSLNQNPLTVPKMLPFRQ